MSAIEELLVAFTAEQKFSGIASISSLSPGSTSLSLSKHGNTGLHVIDREPSIATQVLPRLDITEKDAEQVKISKHTIRCRILFYHPFP